ncbi:hypothetical protein CCR94_20825 [Rhodoblastus sphagnicola]|uniref:AAA+ ATPase domain-containing protein n=1 Tax=Rhodoblastus sphagnicola TaxID=333368 RepID=A0A2S6MXM8_9HYPH|nr:DUF87 domain-containing protein [Rhodoblastus sphagnicola]MBB4196770.1 hypothetical protein [Rhodoblastus sphagnicola]PPQ27122.1 hypothetical protein CCR94_20825 [Rhodoblastus sphagnicola]
MTPMEEAFLEADFNWVSTLQSIWEDQSSDVDGPRGQIVDRIMREFGALRRPNIQKVIGQVINGPAGSGKTHLIGTLRRRVWHEAAWFVFIDVVGVTDFWRTAAFGFVRSLRQTMPDGQSQFTAVFLAALKQLPEATKKEVMRGLEGSGAIRTVNAFVRALQRTFPAEAMQHSDVIRALLLQNDPDLAEYAYSWLQGLDLDPDDRKKLGLTGPTPSPDQVVRGICWLMSLSGPVMIAIDQIDSIVTAANMLAENSAESDGGENEVRARVIIHILANGLMDLHDQTPRAMTVLACLKETWAILSGRALASATARFTPGPRLDSAPWNESAITDLISRRLAPEFARRDVLPPYASWPFSQSAIAGISGSFPRGTLMRCEAYRKKFLDADHVPECATLVDEHPPTPVKPPDDLSRLYEEYRQRAVLSDLTADADDGAPLGRCLGETLEIYAGSLALPDSADVGIAALANDRKPALHARLTFTFHDQNELEKHYCFRVIGHPAALAVQPRLRAAMTDSGIDKKLSFRHLFIIRNTPMPGGRVTGELNQKLQDAGGRIVALGDDDLRSFVALREMKAAKIEGFDAWLRERKPLCDTAFFKAVGLSPPPLSLTTPPGRTSDAPVPKTGVAAEPPVGPPPVAPPTGGPSDGFGAIPLGPRLEGGGEGRLTELPARLLTRHIAIFAGTGSGKTVLLRRILEEAALLGVPAIVLDTNNDLARLGQPWPKRPAAFSEEDAQKAARYHSRVEVVVWTPGLAGGRALTLAVLPDFSALADGAERDQAVDMAWATLAPLVGATGAAKVRKEGVLKESLDAFARGRGGGVEAFITFLADLPSDVSQQRKAEALAADMADQLRAKIAVNPLLNAKGQPLDPAVLFTASRPGATRVSVINFSGLHAEESRQDFVNQLQMALFTFIRKNPSETPRLYALDEAQNFAPSQGMTASKASAMALAAQARKFGLGMIFATQAPKGIETKIVSNCTTHFYGRMSSPALIDATQEMMAARGKAASDLGRLSAGLFYYSTEGMSAPIKIRAPLCLSYHPQNPASPEDVLAFTK